MVSSASARIFDNSCSTSSSGVRIYRDYTVISFNGISNSRNFQAISLVRWFSFVKCLEAFVDKYLETSFSYDANSCNFYTTFICSHKYLKIVLERYCSLQKSWGRGWIRVSQSIENRFPSNFFSIFFTTELFRW